MPFSKALELLKTICNQKIQQKVFLLPTAVTTKLKFTRKIILRKKKNNGNLLARLLAYKLQRKEMGQPTILPVRSCILRLIF